MNLLTLLGVLPIVGPVIAKAPEFVALFNEFTAALHPIDQTTAKAALADIQADNDAGHARLQAKLRDAAAR